jgi:hypothetical protein
MRLRQAWRDRLIIVFSLFAIVQLLWLPSRASAFTRADRQRFQESIIDHRQRLNPNYPRIRRHRTKYIIVHTSELGLKATLRVVSKGKRFHSGRRTNGGHTHYGVFGTTPRKGAFQQPSSQSRVQAAIYLRHLPDDLVHVDRLETSVELIAPIKVDMLPGNRRDIAEPGRVFNIPSAVHVVQKT